jgi:hypothetical protein
VTRDRPLERRQLFACADWRAAVTVEAIEQRGDTRIVAICKCGRSRRAIDVLELPLPLPPPTGAEWIEAYRHWRKGW